MNNITTYKYDACSNLTEIVHPFGHAEFFTYDSLHRKTASGKRQQSGGQNLNVTTYTYDSMGNLLTTTDPMANTTTYRYNLNNQLVKVTDALNNVTAYGYDPCGNRISATNANGHETTYTYDKLNRVLTEKLPGEYTTRWTYDAAGRIAAKTEPKGDTTTYKYDKAGRLTDKTYKDGSMVTYTYDGNGNRLSMDDQLGRTLYQYDANGNLLEIIDCLGRKNTYTYDRANKRKTLTASFGALTYEYDTAARLTALTDFSANRITIGCDADDRINTINYPEGGKIAYTYINLDQIIKVGNTDFKGAYDNLAYQYNGNGFVSSVTHSVKSTNGIPVSIDYSLTYDSLNRLTSIDSEENKSTEYHNAFTYDKLGNRLTHNKKWKINYGGHYENGTYTYNSADLLSVKTLQFSEGHNIINKTYKYGYDANGNQTKETDQTKVWTSHYDYENSLTSVVTGTEEILKNLYNGDGQLMGVIDSKNKNSTYYQYDGSQVIADLDGAGALIASYTRLPSGKLLDMYNCEERRDLYYVFTDRVGSTSNAIRQECRKIEIL